MKILFMGDTHGSHHDVEKNLDLAVRLLEFDVDFIFQVGDFGFVWHDQDSLARLENNTLRRLNIPLMWIDGNHENFDFLAETYGASPDDEDPTRLSDLITYVPRGHRFQIGDIRFMAFGGAVSIDKHVRSPFTSWWPQEAITNEQVERVLERSTDPVDVLISHDCAGTPASLSMSFLSGVPKDLELQSSKNRLLLERLADELGVKMNVHGHFHFPYTERHHDRLYIGLGCGPSSTTMALFDTDDPRF